MNEVEQQFCNFLLVQCFQPFTVWHIQPTNIVGREYKSQRPGSGCSSALPSPYVHPTLFTGRQCSEIGKVCSSKRSIACFKMSHAALTSMGNGATYKRCDKAAGSFLLKIM